MRTIRDQACATLLLLGLAVGVAAPAAANDQVVVAKLPIEAVTERAPPAEPLASSGSSIPGTAATQAQPPRDSADSESENKDKGKSEKAPDRRAWMLLLLGFGHLPYAAR